MLRTPYTEQYVEKEQNVKIKLTASEWIRLERLLTKENMPSTNENMALLITALVQQHLGDYGV